MLHGKRGMPAPKNAVIDMEDASLENAEIRVENAAIREGDRSVENSMSHENLNSENLMSRFLLLWT